MMKSCLHERIVTSCSHLMWRAYAKLSGMIPRIIQTSCIAVVMIAYTQVLRADITVTPWIPIYKGVDRARGTNCPPTTVTNNGVVFTDSSLQVVNCVRVDLSDPDVQLFTTPR